MPYIIPEVRKLLRDNAEAIDKGQLNFLISEIMILYLHRKGLSYENISDAIGAAQDAADEMKRRILAPYEDKKIGQNGDIYQDLLKEL